MTGQQVPEDRYGSRARRRTRPWLHRSLFAAALVGLGGVSMIAYNNFGSPPIEGQHSSYRVLDDRSIHVTVEVERKDPEKPAVCVVRARNKPGSEVGRKEMFIPPASGVVRYETTIRTKNRAFAGEVYGCSYEIPEYLSNPTRPTG